MKMTLSFGKLKEQAMKQTHEFLQLKIQLMMQRPCVSASLTFKIKV